MSPERLCLRAVQHGKIVSKTVRLVVAICLHGVNLPIFLARFLTKEGKPTKTSRQFDADAHAQIRNTRVKLALINSAQIKAGGQLVMGLERITVQQKQEQAEGVQADKHERLRRTLECSGTEELRLLSARQNGALNRLAVRCRAAKRGREIELQGQLARVKGGVARLWRKHNRSCCGNSLLHAGAGGKLSGAEGGGRPSSSGQQDRIIYTRNYDRNTAAVPGGEKGSAGRGGEGELGEAGGDREERLKIGTSLIDGNLSRSGGRRPGDLMNEGGIARVSGATDGGNVQDATAAAPSVPVAEDTRNIYEEARMASSPRFAATIRRKFSSKRGGALWRRKKRINTAAAVETVSAVTTVTDAIGDGSFGVLSEGEARALAALGRGAPHDPRLLLSTFPSPPPQRRRQPGSSPRARVDELKEESALEPTPRDHGFEVGGDVDGYGGNGRESVGGGGRTAVDGGIYGSNEYEVLDRAMEKLAKKIQAEEEFSRRQLGMAPSSM